jgi:hypothetical protein
LIAALARSSVEGIRVRVLYQSIGLLLLVPPNLAGRFAASFALAARLDAATRPLRARRELATAADVYGAAGGTRVATALPHAFYPESSWRDDMELAAAELALAARSLGDARAAAWREAAARWARPGEDTLNLYDTSALAHAEAIRAGADPKPLLRDIRAQLREAARAARRDPFGAARHVRRLRRRAARVRARRHGGAVSRAHRQPSLRRVSAPASATRRWEPTPGARR